MTVRTKAAPKGENIREAGKQARRQRIIMAAEGLIHATGSTDFSMRQLAQQAGLSTYTTYNLIGSKATVLYVLLNQCLDRIDVSRVLAAATGDALEYVLHAGDAGVDEFVASPDFFRALMRYVFGVPDPVHRPVFMDRAFRYWFAATAPLEECGHLGPDLTRLDLARSLQIHFTGTMEFWVHGELDTDQFRAQVRHGMALILLALPAPQWRERLLDSIAATRTIVEALVSRTVQFPASA